MTMTDPIADMLTRIRNANQANLKKVVCPASKIKANILDIFTQEGFIKGYKRASVDGKGVLVILLRYSEENVPVITGLKRNSRPGLRYYVRKDKIPKVRNGMGCAVISTSKGVMSDRQARRADVGGEVLCSIW